MCIPNENKHLISRNLEVVPYYFHRTLDLYNGPLLKTKKRRMLETETSV